MQRFFLPVSLGDSTLILQDDEIMYQLVKVLRSQVGDEVIFFDGVHHIDFQYKITSIDKKNIIFSFVNKIEKPQESVHLVLFQSLPNKIDKIEEIIQKGTEVGYSEFHFFRAERSQDLRLSPNKIERFQKIIKEASEQSGRNIVPSLCFEEKLDISQISGTALFFHTDTQNAKKISEISFSNKENINVFIGPEGGFSPRENEHFEKNHFLKINLGNNILRTENAPIVVGFYILQK